MRKNLIEKKSKLFGFILLSLLFLLSITIVSAKSAHMKLLAVSEGAEGLSGSVADLYLEVKKGSGRVFIDTFPLTKVDTQISTRFAKEIACDYIDQDCSRYDFVYTIRSGSSIIGGPSAGVAITVLTVATLMDYSIDETVTMTGTINSGGIVGNVGGVKEKIEAASTFGEISKVLIPGGEKIITEDNITIDLVEYGSDIGVNVIPVSELDEAIYQFTGQITKKEHADVIIESNYQDTMKSLSEILCGRGEELKGNVKVVKQNESLFTLYESTINLTNDAKFAFDNGKFYSSASFCFGANIRLAQMGYFQKNLTEEELVLLTEELQLEVEEFKENLLLQEIHTITDLEAFMIVNERVSETETYFEFIYDALENNDTNSTYYFLAYAQERFESAMSWSKFLDNPGKEFVFNDQSLRDSCISKLSEVEERIQYVRFFLPTFFTDESTDLTKAYVEMERENYALCLFKAGKAKAQADVVLSVIGVTEGKIDSLLDLKLDAVKRIIAEQTEQEIFPILGYSYYEYAQSLAESDVNSALLYSEYALELSGLDMYFEKKKSFWDGFYFFDYKVFLIFLMGVIFGLFFGMVLMYTIISESRKNKINHKKKRKY